MVQQNAGSTELDQAEIRGYLSWRHPFRNLQIYMHPSAVGTLQNRVLLGCFAARSSEVGGILLGKILPGKPERCVVIDDLQFVEPTTQLFNTTEGDRSRLDAAIKQARTDSGLTPVGYFRSHIRPGLCLSPQDQSFIEANLRDPDDVFLIIRPNEIGVCAAAFFFWQRGQLQTDLSDLKLVSISDDSAMGDLPVDGEAASAEQPVPAIEKPLADADHPPAVEAHPGQQTPHEESADAMPGDRRSETVAPGSTTTHDASSRSVDLKLPAEGRAASYDPQPDIRSEVPPVPSVPHPRPDAPYGGGQRSNVLVWALACTLLAALCVIGYFALGVVRGRKQGAGTDHAGTDIGLRVEAVPGGQLNVSWNQDMPQLAAMQHAALTIVDGTVRRNLDIDNSQFRFGKLTYVPNSTDVQFQLEVFLPGNRSMAESVRVVVSAPQGGTFQADLAPPRVLESSRPASIPEPKARAVLDASPKRVAAAPFRAPLAPPVVKRQTESTSPLYGIAAPAVPASPLHELPPSVASFSYVPPSKDVASPVTVQPFRKDQNTQSNQSTYIPPQNEEPRSGRVTRLENATQTSAAAGAGAGSGTSPQSAPAESSSPAGPTSSPLQTSAAYSPPVAVREVRPSVPLGLLGVISSEQAVEVLVNIDPKGRVSDARLVASKGAISGLLSQAALAAARDYRFKPARHNGVAVASRLTITFRFVR
jgi:TonB family protein